MLPIVGQAYVKAWFDLAIVRLRSTALLITVNRQSSQQALQDVWKPHVALRSADG
jgi:hypothetical protein